MGKFISFIIHIEKPVKFCRHSFLKRHINLYHFMFINGWLSIHYMLQCLHDNILKVCLTIFAMLHMNNLCNRYYINTLSRVFYIHFSRPESYFLIYKKFFSGFALPEIQKDFFKFSVSRNIGTAFLRNYKNFFRVFVS